MKLATRLNSFLRTEKSILAVFNNLKNIENLNYVDLNYPEHFNDVSVKEVKDSLQKNNLKVNGLAMRFKKPFINGKISDKDKTAAQAIDLCKEAIDITKELNGTQLTIWLGYDGFDYSFQVNYEEVWKQLVNSFRKIADYDKSIIISIEYKPYEPRSYSIIPDVGTTLLMVNDVDRDNVGVTLDYCHMLMKGENPAYGLSLTSLKNKLYGVHLNDGYGMQDDGLIVGSVSFIKTLEFLYYMKKNNYDGVIYFDTFPLREKAIEESKINIKMLKKYLNIIDRIGMDYIQAIINKNDAIEAQKIFLKAVESERGV